MNIYAEEGAEQTATISVEGTTEQPALSGGTIILHSGKLSATAAEGGQMASDDLELLLNNGVSGDNLSGGEVQDNGLVKYTATQLNSLTSLTLTTATYAIGVKEGTEDADNWSASPNPAAAGQTVTVSYGGTKHVKGFKVKKKAATPAATVTTAPSATADVLAGSTTALVSAGVAEGGTMMYKVTTESTQPASTDGFSATVPTAESLAAGTYYVWYYVQADDTHTDSEISAAAIEVTVKAATPQLLTLNVAGQTIYYATGESWRQAITNHPDENAGWSVGPYMWDQDLECVMNGGTPLWDQGLNDGMGGLVSPDSQVYTSGSLAFGD